MVIYPSFQGIRYGNCVWVEIFDVSQIKVKLEKTEGGARKLEKTVEPAKLEKIHSCSKTPQNSFLSNFNLDEKIFWTRNLNMLSWEEVDFIDHFAWGLVNQRCRSVCLLEVSRDTSDIMIMLVGDEVGCSILSLFSRAFCR